MPSQEKTELNIAGIVTHGDLNSLSSDVVDFIVSNARICLPDNIHICDGSEEENKKLIHQMEETGMIKSLPKYENWYVSLCYRRLGKIWEFILKY